MTKVSARRRSGGFFVIFLTICIPNEIIIQKNKTGCNPMAVKNTLSRVYNDISLTQYDIRRCRMIYLLRKHGIISVPSYAKGIYHPPQVDITSKINHPFCKERISLKKVTFVGRQM